MLVPCPHRGDHKIRKGYMHGPSRCPPPPGKRGDRYHSLHLRKEQMMGAILFDQRGASVAGTGKPSASSEKKTHVKGKIAGTGTTTGGVR